MARSFAPALIDLVRHDGAWLRCVEPGCDAYWGDFRPTAFVAAKAQQHVAKAHGARPARRQAGRPQRRAAGNPAQGLDFLLAGFNPREADAHKQGWTRLGAGVHRVTYDMHNGFVVKFAHSANTRTNNIAEARTWQTAPSHRRRWLAPVAAFAHDGAWLVMPKATNVGDWAIAAQVQSALGSVIRDLHAGNVGLLNGNPVAIDYGFGGQW